MIAWYIIPLLGWTAVISFMISEINFAWYITIALVLWTAICIIWGILGTKESDIKIYQDALINKKLYEDEDEN